MSDLHEIFLRAKEREAEEELEAKRTYKPVTLKDFGLSMIIDDRGRLIFESKKDACF